MQLVKISGVSIRIHPTFLVVLILYGFLGLAAQAFLVFGLVFCHELAHLMTTRAYGFKIVGLELYPFGGAAKSDDLFEGRKFEESMIALAGTFLNIVLLFVGQVLRWKGLWTGELADDFVRFNFWLAAFNLIPVLPLDGGRVVRAFFAASFGYVKTTKFLAWSGKWLGLLIALYGIVLWGQGNFTEGALTYIILGGFFWIAGDKEVKYAHITFLRQLTRKKEDLLKKGLMRSFWFTVQGETHLVRIVEQFTPDRYGMISVTNPTMGLDKILTETEVVEGMFREGIHFPVGKL